MDTYFKFIRVCLVPYQMWELKPAVTKLFTPRCGVNQSSTAFLIFQFSASILGKVFLLECHRETVHAYSVSIMSQYTVLK